MFIVLLRFAENRDQVAAHLDGHRAWLRQGFDEGVFLLAGRLVPELGGGLLAAGCTRDEIEARVKADPFVAGKVVTAEILEMEPALAGPQMRALLPEGS